MFEKYLKILICIQKSPKSIIEISTETNIPITTVYRLISVFEKNDLLLLKDNVVTPKYPLFQSKGNFEILTKKLHDLNQT